VQLALFPEVSVTVNVTLLVPMSEQSKLVCETVIDAIAQLSELPPSTSEAVMVALPDPSKATVMFWQTADGANESSTVTTAVQLLLFPAASVTVSVTLLAPILEQLKLVCETVIEAIEQLSVLPPSTSEAVMDALPEASKATVMFWQTADGANESSTVTTAVQLLLFPAASVTVSVTLLAPILEQLKFVWETVLETIAQLSELPPSTAEAVMVALPEPSKATVMFWQLATGFSASVMVTSNEQV
jgi:phage tail protein X